MEPSPPVLIAKKFCNMVRIPFFVLQKGVSKSKLLPDLHFMMKRGKILGKALNDLMLHHHTTLSCRSHDVHMSFVSPREYEFSCSNSPAHQPFKPFHASRRRAHFLRKHHKHYKHAYCHAPPCRGDDDVAVKSSLVGLNSFGWRSPLVRQVRITNSPLQRRDADEDCHVDKEAEKFIERFYKELRLQKWMALHEAADYYG